MMCPRRPSHLKRKTMSSGHSQRSVGQGRGYHSGALEFYAISRKTIAFHSWQSSFRRVWERCRAAKNLDSLIIATDDMRIAEAAFDWGAEVALTSTSHRSGTDRVAEVAGKTKQFAYIVNIQGDEPLIDPRLIDKLVEKAAVRSRSGNGHCRTPIRKSDGRFVSHQVKVVARSCWQRSLFLAQRRFRFTAEAVADWPCFFAIREFMDSGANGFCNS